MSIKNLEGKAQQQQENEKKGQIQTNKVNSKDIIGIDQGREGVDYDHFENVYNPKNEENNQELGDVEINQEEEQDDKKYPFMCMSEVVKMQRNTKKNKKIVFDVTDTIYRVIKNQGSISMGWTTITSPPQNREEWNICWYDTYVSEEVLRRLLPYQKINHFPGSYHLGKKNYLAQNLTKMRKVLENEYSFFPRTWTLPVQFEEFKRYNESIKTKKPYYIVKPESSCQGRGIYLTKKIESFSYSDHCVIQEYLKTPFLIDGLKFDFRIYVLIKNINPLKIFMYPEGLARFATVKYQKPTKKNCQNFTMHLTNYAVNKKSPNFVFNENDQNDDVGHKRSFSSVLKQLYNMGKDVSKLYMEIRQLIVKTVISVQPQLSHIYRSSQPKEYQNEMCFEILGFDVMIDDKLKPWLLEVNHSASFHCDSPLDSSIKKNVILDTLNILNVSSKEKKKYLEMKSQAQFAYRKKDQSKSAAETDTSKIDQEKIIKYENKHKGAFLRIYPAEDDSTDYEKILKIANNIWNESVSPKKVNPAAQNHHNSSSNPPPLKSDQKNLKTTPVKKPMTNDSISVLNSTQISQPKSDIKQKISNSTKKNLSQIFDDQREKTPESFLNFLPNLSKGIEIINTGGNTGRNKQGVQIESNAINISTNVSQANLKNDGNKQNESQIILNCFQDDFLQIENEKIQQEDILQNIVAKKRSMTQIESHAKIRNDSSKQYLIHASSFQYPLTQQQSTNKLNQASPFQDQYFIINYQKYSKTSVIGKGGIYQENNNLIIQQQQQGNNQNGIQPAINNFQPQYGRSNHFNQKILDAFNEDAIQIKPNKISNFNIDQGYNSIQQTNLFQNVQQPQSLDYQRKLNIVNLGMNSPDQFINESWYSQTQKPIYLRTSARKPYKTQLKPLSSDFQSVIQRENRSSNSNKFQNHQNESLLTGAAVGQPPPKYLTVRKNNIPAKYGYYYNQQNVDNIKQQVDYLAAEQIISRTKNNSMPQKGQRQESNQPSPNINSNNNIYNAPLLSNFPSVQQQNLNISGINHNNIFSTSNISYNNNNNMSINTINTQVSSNNNPSHSSNNGKNIINQEAQMSYSKRRILRKSIERKQIKDMILNESLAGNFKVDQFSKQSIKSDQLINPIFAQMRHKTTDSIDYNNNSNNNQQNVESQTIGGLNYQNGIPTSTVVVQSNTTFHTQQPIMSPSHHKQEDYQIIMSLRNQEQPILVQNNLHNYQSSLLNKNASNHLSNALQYGNISQQSNNNDAKPYQKNQFMAQNQLVIQNNNKQLQIKK